MLLVVAGFSMEHFNDLLNTRACVKKAFIDSEIEIFFTLYSN